MLLKSNLNSQCEVQQLHKNLIVPEAQYGECIFPPSLSLSLYHCL